MRRTKREKLDVVDLFCCPPVPEPIRDGLPYAQHAVQHAIAPHRAVWPDNVRELHVRFLEPYDVVIAQRIADIVTGAWGWNAACGMQFVFDQREDAQIRVAFEWGEGSWSQMGTDCLGVPLESPTMNFGWFTRRTGIAEYSRTSLHEFGHALSLGHEHQSPYLDIPWDKDKVYAYYAKRMGWKKGTVDHNVLNKYKPADVRATEGDPESIMCYLIDPLFLTDTSLIIGGNTELSELDKKLVQEMYGLPPQKWLNLYAPVVSG